MAGTAACQDAQAERQEERGEVAELSAACKAIENRHAEGRGGTAGSNQPSDALEREAGTHHEGDDSQCRTHRIPPLMRREQRLGYRCNDLRAFSANCRAACSSLS